MYDLYWFRVDAGLEYPIMFDMMYFDPYEWSMCSSTTRDLAKLYTDHMMWNCCDDRPMNFYPLLTRIEEWLDEEYGSP